MNSQPRNFGYDTGNDDRILSLKEVCKKTTLSKTQIYRLEAAGSFPRRVSLGPGRVGWSNREILGWIEDQKRKRAVHPANLDKGDFNG